MPIFRFTGYTLMELFTKRDNWRQTYKQTRLTFHSSNMCLKHVEKKKIIRTSQQGHFFKQFCKIAVWLLLKKYRSSHRRCSTKKLLKISKFAEKHLYWSLFLIENLAKSLGTPILKNIYKRLFLKIKIKIAHKEFLTLY